jgi:hypothetical protein
VSQARTNKPETPLAYSPAKAARLCGVSRPTFIKHIQPKLNLKRVGRRVIIPRISLEAYLAGEQQ